MSTTLETPAEAPASGSRSGAAIGIAILLLAQLMIILDSTIVNVALPAISADLHFTGASRSWVLDGYILAFGGLLLLGGRLGDVLGRRRLFAVGLAVFSAFSLLSGLAPNAGLLIAARALQGAGGALAAPQVLALLTANAPSAAARNRALALFAIVSALGGMLGYVLGGLLTDLASWRWTLLINVPLGLVALAFVGRFVTETPRRAGRFDVVGAVSATGAASTLVWALTGAPGHGWGAPQTVGGLAAAAVLLAVFVVTESRVPHPLLRLGLLRSHQRSASLIATFAYVGSQYAMYFLVTQFIQLELGYSPIEAGLAFVPITVGSIFLSRLVSRVMKRVPGAVLMTLGSVITLLSFWWVSGVDGSSTYAGSLLGPLLLFSLATSLMVLPGAAGSLAGVEPEHAGSASGLFQTMQQLGAATGVAVIASVYATHSVPGEFLPGVKPAFAAAAVLAGITGLASLSMLRLRPHRYSTRQNSLPSGSCMTTTTPPS